MRFRSWTLGLAVLLVALAGCSSPPDEGSETPTPTPTPTPDPDPDFEPTETGSELTRDEIAELALVFSDEPLTGGQEPWPGHLVKWVNDETFVFLHFSTDDPLDDDAQLLWTGIGTRGVFCAQAQPGAEFTHFHQYDAPTYAEGHGGSGGEEGYWLAHFNVRAFDSPFGATGRPGHHEGFGPTVPPTCDVVPTASHDPPNSDGLDAVELAALSQVYDDQPLTESQTPWPSHLLKWVTPDVFVLLHFDAEDPMQASKQLWSGMGVRGTFCASDKPGPEFTHHHQYDAPEYAAGHGGQPGEPGYWLLHIASHDFESPFGPTGGPGIHEQFGPTDPPQCGGASDGDDAPASTIGHVGDCQAAAHHIELMATGDSSTPYAFSPERVDVGVGETVCWHSTDDVFHTVTSTDSDGSKNGHFDATMDSEGKTFAYTFTAPGEHHYQCSPHAAFMEGVIAVL